MLVRSHFKDEITRVYRKTLEVHLPPIIMQITPLKPYKFIICLARPMVVQIKSFFDKIFQFLCSR